MKRNFLLVLWFMPKCRKTHPCDYRISKFSGGACPRTPLGGKAQFFARVSNSVALLFKTSMNPLKPRDHAIPFYIELNCLPLQSLFFQQLSYLMYMTFMLRQLLSLRKSIQNIIIIRDYLQKNVSLSNSLELKKWKNLLLELVCLSGILFHFLLRLSTYLIFVKKN